MKKIQKRYNRFAAVYDFLGWFFEKRFFYNHRRKIIPRLKGQILEIGVGTGANLSFYSNKAQVTAIDFSSKMLKRASKRLEKLDKTNIVLAKADAEHLPFDNNVFDYVIATCVFCSIPNPIQAFQEAKRVLKNNGQAIFLEHVQARNKLIAKIQNFFNPLFVRTLGCNINRKTKENIEKSRLKIIKDKKLGSNDIWRLFVCQAK